MKFKLILIVLGIIAAVATLSRLVTPTARSQSIDFPALIAESLKAPPDEKLLIYSDHINGRYVTITNRWFEPKRILVDSTSREAAELIRIARPESGGLYIPDDAVPKIEIQGDRLLVTFYPKSGEGDFYAEVQIDIKTKKLLGMTGPAD